MSKNLKLVIPDNSHAEEYNRMVQESIQIDGSYPYNNIDLAESDFPAFVQELAEEAEGINLPEDIPAQQTYLLLLDDKTVIGEFRFRPEVKQPYEDYNGHIGYNLRPDYRGKGFGTIGLKLMLGIARKQGLRMVQIPITGENPASVRIVEKNGGRLDKTVTDESGEKTACYMVTL